MFARTLMLAAAAAVMAGAATAAPSDYAFEPTTNAQGAGTVLTVRLRHIPSGAYVDNASVTRIERHQSFKGPAPFAETRRALRPVGNGIYSAVLPLSQAPASGYHLVATVPGESSAVHAMVDVPTRAVVAMPK